MASPTRLVCPNCSSASPRGMSFCGRCGAPLGDAAPSPWQPPPRAPLGERRLLTVLFCDMVGSTRLASLLEPEDLRHVLLTYRDACATSVQRFGGTIGQYLGDGILAYFGYPRAHEDDGRRALRAALSARDAMAGVNAKLAAAGVALPAAVALRIGVHSGVIVVGDLGRGRNAEAAAVIGETTNIAARLQAAAATGTVLISEATAKLVAKQFDLVDAGERLLPGVDLPVRTFEARAERPSGTLATPRALTRFSIPFFDRDEQRALMRKAWNATVRGRGACLVLEAEPGMGKSRLAYEFRLQRGRAGRAASILTCSPEDRSSSFHPLLTWVRRSLDVAETSSADIVRHALAAALAGSGHADHETQLAVLLDCATEAERRAVAQSPRRRRRNLVDAFLAFLRTRMPADAPHIVILEDLHWADDGTLAFARALAERCGPGAKLLVLVTTRPPAAELGLLARIVKLERLPETDAASLVRAVVPPDTADELVRQIVQRTDGIPLFAEELARLSGTVDPAPAGTERAGAIPLTLRSTLSAQLDALGRIKLVAQVAAALGRAFQQDVLEAIAEPDERDRIGPALARLVDARLIEPQFQPDQPHSYAFRHALIRDAAYDSMVRDRRRALHGRIGRVLGERFHTTPQGRPEILAQHFAAADIAASAAEYFEIAAARAAARSTPAEAVEHCRSGLAQLAKIRDDASTAEPEIRLQILLAAQVTAARGNADPSVQAAFERARHVAEQIGHDRWLRRALRGLHTFYLVKGDIERGLLISERILELAAGETDPGQRIQLHRPHGLTLLYMGRFADAKAELLSAIALYDSDAHADHRFEYGSDPLVLARSHLGWVEWFLGDADAAAAECAAAVAFARALEHPHSLAFALAFQTCLAEFMGDAEQARTHADELVHVAEQQGYAYWSAWGRILGGWATAMLGHAETGLALLQRGVAEYEETGAGLLVPYAEMLRAELLEPTDRRAAERLLKRANDRATRTMMGIWTAWSHHRAAANPAFPELVTPGLDPRAAEARYRRHHPRRRSADGDSDPTKTG